MGPEVDRLGVAWLWDHARIRVLWRFLVTDYDESIFPGRSREGCTAVELFLVLLGGSAFIQIRGF